MKRGVSRILDAMEPTVFLGSAALVVVFVLLGSVFTERTSALFEALQSGIITHLGWFYIAAASGLLLFVVWLPLSPFAKIRLGGPDAEPEFSYPAWVAMLFAAGMGIGLIFWGVAEPLTHYQEPVSAEPETVASLREAMRFSYYHWGLHPWAIYIVFALGIGYAHYNRGLPLAPRSLLYPLVGDRIFGPIGHAVDIAATVGTLFGVATSLGLGAMQINAGLEALAGISKGTGTQVTIILVITAVATVSVVSGLHKGIQWLSTGNLLLALLLLLFVLFAGPTVFVLDLFVSSLGEYLQQLPRLSFWLDLRKESDWQAQWTLFYWSWWISWSPFVGVFTARISRGRTLREFVCTVLVAPALLTFLWLAVFGGTALEGLRGGEEAVARAVEKDPALSLHALLSELPFQTVTTVVGTVLVIVFFITSSDSGSLVDDMVTSGGHPNPPAAQRIFWACSEGAVAATLLLAGGLEALRTASLASGLPMAVILLCAAWGLVRALRRDHPRY